MAVEPLKPKNTNEAAQAYLRLLESPGASTQALDDARRDLADLAGYTTPKLVAPKP